MSSTTTKTILLVGASRGLGAGMAGELVKRGWHVVGTVRGGARTPLHALADAHPNHVSIEQVDIDVPAQIAKLRELLAERVFDILFVNAGIASRETAAEITTEDFVRLMQTNALGVMRAVEALQHLVRADGLIGVMSSGQGSIANNANGLHDVYRASKSALNQLMKSYAVRHASDARALLLLAPGWIKTGVGGSDAPLTVEQAIPHVVDVLLAQQGTPGLRFVDRDGNEVPW